MAATVESRRAGIMLLGGVSLRATPCEGGQLDMSIQLEGEIVGGLGAGQFSLTLQLPYFTSRFPQLAGCHPGTINVRLSQPLRIEYPDFETPPLKWAGHNQPAEAFRFVEVQFESPIGAPHRPAWIYIPLGSPHQNNPFQVELMSHFINQPEAISAGTRCLINIDRPHRIETIQLVIITQEDKPIIPVSSQPAQTAAKPKSGPRQGKRRTSA
jgi:hypothetical protein